MGDSETATIRERVSGRPIVFGSDESILHRWLLFYGDRAHVSAVVLVAVFLSLLILHQLRPVEYHRLLSETTVVQTVFNTILGGVILLVSIVVAVASVGVSKELTTIGEQRDRVSEATGYREQLDLPESIETLPAQPGAFLMAVLQTIQERSEDLDRMTEGTEPAEANERITTLQENIRRNTSEVLGTLEQVESGTTEELLVGLDYDASRQLHQTNVLLTQERHELSEDDVETLERVGDRIRYFMIGREYFKSVYYKREFSELSKSLLLVSLPVIVFITYVMLALDAGLFPDLQFLGFTPLVLFVSLAYTISLAPYVLLSAYVFRAACVTKRTMSSGPFIHESGEIEFQLS